MKISLNEKLKTSIQKKQEITSKARSYVKKKKGGDERKTEQKPYKQVKYEVF